MPLRNTSSKLHKFEMYERSVQTPDVHAKWFVSVYKELRHKFPRKLREDFCGTFQISAAWVSRNKRNSAIGLDLDPECLAYGKRHHFAGLSREQKSRLQVLRQNVISITNPKSDVIAACNFSFYIFHERKTLLEYFRACHQSLAKDGLLVLEMAGGPGFIEQGRERKTLHEKGRRAFTYVWHQKSFDPIQRRGHYAIHFLLPNGRKLRDAFTYDWRIWTIPEVRDTLLDSGFKKVHVYWETSHRGEGTGEYARANKGDNAYSWLAYIAAEK